MGIQMALRPLILFVLAFALGSYLATARGDDFRVETRVYLEKEVEPAFETLTVFSGDVVYDFVLSQGSAAAETTMVTVFDQRRGRIVLLDGERKIQTELTTQWLSEFTTKMREGRDQNEQGGALFRPVFSVTHEESAHQITMTSDGLTYRVTGEMPKDSTAAKRYRSFADWFARLNAARGGIPPFGRIELNRILNEEGLLPVRIERTLVRGRKKSQVHSEHASNWTLSNTDRRRIDQAGQMMAELPSVSPLKFWGVKTEVATAR